MEFHEVVKDRYSCKGFGPGKVPAEKLNAILEAGRLAPTAIVNPGYLIFAVVVKLCAL